METLNHRFRELGNKINRRQIMIKKKILAFLLVLTIISSLLLGVDLVVYADLENTVNLDEIVGGDLPAGVTYGGNVLTIGTGANGTTITLRGTTNENRLVVGDEVEDLILILDDVEIRPSSGSPISLQGSASVTIELAEDTINILDGSGAEDYAGLNVPGLSSLTIRGTGSLEAIGGEYGAGIGGGYRGSGGNISISGGNIEAIGGHSGAGIGGGSERSGGIITISGGHIEAIGGHYGAGIGGGNEGNGGSITITDGHIE
ncbi:MAG: carbohydrate-binding domain-containing protein, partial [Tissierellaceae bacterium]